MRPQERTRALLRSGLDPESKLVAIALADYLSADNGVAWPSIGTLARDTGLAESTVRRRIHAGERNGWIQTERPTGQSNRYLLLWDSLPESQIAPLSGGHPCQADTPTPVSVAAPPCQADTPTPVRLTPEGTSEGTSEGTTTSANAEVDHEPEAQPLPRSDRPPVQPAGDGGPSTGPDGHARGEPDAAASSPPAGGLFDLGAPLPDAGPAAGGVRGKRKAAGDAEPADAVAALWEELDAIRRKNMSKASPLMLTPGRRKSLRARMAEHDAADLRMMADWVTGCTCKQEGCRACYLQKMKYADPDTYLRPDNCAKYIERARDAQPTMAPAGEDWIEADACRALAAKCIESGADIDPPDRRMWLLTRRTLRVIGGRPAWRGKTSTPAWAEAWRAEWPNSIAALNAKQEIV